MGKIKGKYIEDDAIDEANLLLETGPTNDFVLTADDSKTGGMKWQAGPSGTTNLSEGTATETTVDVDSSTGTNATLVSASASRAGLLTKEKFDEIVANTTDSHTQNTDTALGSGAVAADHGTASTDQIINVCYGTSATPPTASTTTEGTLYIQYTA